MPLHGDHTWSDLTDPLLQNLHIVLFVILDLRDIWDNGLLIVVLLVAEVALQKKDFGVFEPVLHPLVGDIGGQDDSIDVVNLAEGWLGVLDEHDVDVLGEVHRVVQDFWDGFDRVDGLCDVFDESLFPFWLVDEELFDDLLDLVLDVQFLKVLKGVVKLDLLCVLGSAGVKKFSQVMAYRGVWFKMIELVGLLIIFIGELFEH